MGERPCPRCGLIGEACRAQADAEWEAFKAENAARREAEKAARRAASSGRTEGDA